MFTALFLWVAVEVSKLSQPVCRPEPPIPTAKVPEKNGFVNVRPWNPANHTTNTDKKR